MTPGKMNWFARLVSLRVLRRPTTREILRSWSIFLIIKILNHLRVNSCRAISFFIDNFNIVIYFSWLKLWRLIYMYGRSDRHRAHPFYFLSGVWATDCCRVHVLWVQPASQSQVKLCHTSYYSSGGSSWQSGFRSIQCIFKAFHVEGQACFWINLYLLL